MHVFAMEINRIDARYAALPPQDGTPTPQRTAPAPASPASPPSSSGQPSRDTVVTSSGGVTFGTYVSFATPAYGYASPSTDRSSPSAAFPSSGLSTGMQLLASQLKNTQSSFFETQEALLKEILALRVALLAAYVSFAQQRSLELLLPRPLGGAFGTPLPKPTATIPTPIAKPTFGTVQQAYGLAGSTLSTALRGEANASMTGVQPMLGGSPSLISILA
jgi:hypothetical protein